MLVVIVLPLVVYAQVLRFDFLNWDDRTCLVDNPHFTPLTATSVTYYWGNSYRNQYEPMNFSFLAAETALSHTLAHRRHAMPTRQQAFIPGVFHGGSLVLHIAVGLLVFLLLRRHVGHSWAAAAGALLFSLHPLQAESVAWVSETRSPLCALFAVGSLLCCDAWLTGRVRQSGHLYLAASVLFVLAVLSKPITVAVPLIALVLAWSRGHALRRAALGMLPWIIAAAAIILVAKTNQPDSIILHVPALWQRPLVAGDAVAVHLAHLILPIGLGPDYGRTPQVVLTGWYGAINTGLLVILLVAARRLSATRAWLVPTGVYLLALGPVLGLVPFVHQHWSTVADRYSYLAMLGPALGLAAFAAAAGSRVRKRFCFGLIVVLALLAHRQTGYWRNDATLLGRGLAVNPSSVRSHHNLSVNLLKRGDLAGALHHSQHAVDLSPNTVRIHFQLGLVKHAMGDWDTARREFTRELEIQPDWTMAANALAWVLAAHPDPARRDADRAVAIAERVVERTAGLVPSYKDTLAHAYASRGQYAYALTTAHQAHEEALIVGDRALAADIEKRIEVYRKQSNLRP